MWAYTHYSICNAVVWFCVAAGDRVRTMGHRGDGAGCEIQSASGEAAVTAIAARAENTNAASASASASASAPGASAPGATITAGRPHRAD